MLPSQDLVSLELPKNYVGQVLDGIDVLIEQWEDTAECLMGVEDLTDGRVIRDCSGPVEARSMAALYKEIRDAIRSQLVRGNE